MAHSNVQIGGIAHLFIAIVASAAAAAVAFVDYYFLVRTYTFYASGMLNAYHVIGKSHGVSSAAAAAATYIFILLFCSLTESQFSMPNLYNNNKFSPTLIGEEIFKCLKFNQFSCEVELFGEKKRI